MIVNFTDYRYCGGKEISVDSSEVVQIYFIKDYAGEYYRVKIETDNETYEVAKYSSRAAAANAVKCFFRALSGDDFYRALAGDCTVYNWGSEFNEETTANFAD